MNGVLGMKYFITLHTGLDPNTTPEGQFTLPAWQKSLITSVLSAGTFFGALIAGDLADWIGRRWTIISGCAIFTVGNILQTASSDGLGLVSYLLYPAAMNRTDKLDCSWSIDLWCRSRIRFRHHHSLHVRGRTQEGPRSYCLWLPILHHHRSTPRILRSLRHPGQARHWILQDPHRCSIPMGVSLPPHLEATCS